MLVRVPGVRVTVTAPLSPSYYHETPLQRNQGVQQHRESIPVTAQVTITKEMTPQQRSKSPAPPM